MRVHDYRFNLVYLSNTWPLAKDSRHHASRAGASRIRDYVKAGPTFSPVSTQKKVQPLRKTRTPRTKSSSIRRRKLTALTTLVPDLDFIVGGGWMMLRSSSLALQKQIIHLACSAHQVAILEFVRPTSPPTSVLAQMLSFFKLQCVGTGKRRTRNGTYFRAPECYKNNSK